MTGEANDATAEEILLESIELLCDQIHVPIAVRLSPFHSSLGNFAWRLTEAGASGVVCFATEPLCQITPRGVAVGLEWPLSPAGHIHTTISGLLRLKKSGPAISIAASGGVSSTEDICKVVLAGANVAMVTSEIYRSGPEVIAHLVEGSAVIWRGMIFRPSPISYMLAKLRSARRAFAPIQMFHHFARTRSPELPSLERFQHASSIRSFVFLRVDVCNERGHPSSAPFDSRRQTQTIHAKKVGILKGSP